MGIRIVDNSIEFVYNLTMDKKLILFLSLCLLNISDGIFTSILVDSPAEELNYLMALVIENYGFSGIFMVKAFWLLSFSLLLPFMKILHIMIPVVVYFGLFIYQTLAYNGLLM